MSDFLTLTPVPSIIGGKPVESQSTYDVIRTDDPAGKAVLHQVTCCGVQDAQRAVETAREAAKTWSKTSANERRTILFRAAEMLRDGKVLEKYGAISNEETVNSKNFSMFESEWAQNCSVGGSC